MEASVCKMENGLAKNLMLPAGDQDPKWELLTSVRSVPYDIAG